MPGCFLILRRPHFLLNCAYAGLVLDGRQWTGFAKDEYTSVAGFTSHRGILARGLGFRLGRDFVGELCSL
jgi:hypothetical protein